MNKLEVNFKISGVSICVPAHKSLSEEINFTNETEEFNFINKVGIKSKRTSKGQFSVLDLCFNASKELLKSMSWNPEDVNMLISVTQSPEYNAPGNSYLLQSKLGLSSKCILTDFSAGCTGWIQGMVHSLSLSEVLGFKKILLVSGDTNILADSEIQKSDRLMGDMGTATAIEFTEEKRSYFWSIRNYGDLYDIIYTPFNGAANYRKTNSLLFHPKMQMDSERLHQFITNHVVKDIKEFRENLPYIPDKTLIHQPNKIHTNYLLKKMKIDTSDISDILSEFGNISSASIPYSLFAMNKENNFQKISCHAFGVGLSTANIAFDNGRIICPKIIEIGE